MSVTSLPAMKNSDNVTSTGMKSDTVVQEEAIMPQPATYHFVVQEEAIVPQPATHNFNVNLEYAEVSAP